MAKIKLSVTERSELGTRRVRRLRASGIVPGVVYGKGKKVLPVKVPIKEIHRVKGGHVVENVLLDLIIGEGKAQTKKTVIVKEIQKNSMKGDWLHIDFNEISLLEKLKAPVSIEITGEAKGIVEGGVLEQIMHELEVECLPTDIPEHIIVDVSNLEIGHTIYVKDLIVSQEVTILSGVELPVVSVAAPRVEEEVAVAPVEGEVEEAAEPEVIGKGKKEEEEVEAEAGEEAEKKPKKETK